MSTGILDINKHPELKTFIDSEPPNILISENRNKSYRVRSSSRHHSIDVTLFDAACFYGKIDHIRALYHDMEEMRRAISTGEYFSFRLSAENGHTTTLQYLETHLTPAEKKEAVKAKNYAAIRMAALSGHTATLQYLETHLTDTEKKDAVTTENYDVIRQAANNGHTATLQHLETHLTPAEKIVAVKGWDYEAIRLTARHGHTVTLQYLETHLAPAEKIVAVKAWDYGAIRSAAENGHMATLQYLETHLTSAEKKEAVKAQDYTAIRMAAENGHMATLQYLETHLTPAEKKEAVKAQNYGAIRSAAENGHMATLQYLETHLTPAEKNEAVKVRNYEAIRSAAENGHMATLQYLETHLTPAEKKEAVRGLDYCAICSAGKNGHTATLQHLETHLTSAEKKEAVKAQDYIAIQMAAKNGHTATLQHIETHLTPDEKRAAVKEQCYEAIRGATQNGHTATLQHFFKIDIALAYMEMHVREYGYLVLPYVQQKLASLRADKAALETSNPDAVFNVPEEEARCVYYMARHLIRLNPTDYRDDLLFLLEIPQVKHLAHRRLNDGEENELLRLALSLGNQIAAQLLLAIPSVNDLARTHDYYRAESQGGLDLRALAANRESSITALSQGEQQRLSRAIGHYESFIKSAGVPKIMHDLREALKGRYENRPAKIQKDNGETLTLPLNYSSFTALQLSDNEKQRALEAYYRHKDHTAFRYLSRPNDWMSPKASFVNVDDTRTQRWSTFEEYEPLITMLYCAARDEHTPATDGFTLETRFEHFIDELAHIGRAHNWDRMRQSANGELDAYDDLEGDKPSCFSGVKRRLFQSVLGHPLLTMLTEERVEAEVNEFARAHFFGSITGANREAVLDALNKVIAAEDLTDEDERALAQTDISNEKYDQFIELMNQKYGAQFTSELKFLVLIKQAIGEKRGHCAHILYFGCVIRSLLAPVQAQTNPGLSSSMGLFSTFAEPDAPRSAPANTNPKP